MICSNAPSVAGISNLPLPFSVKSFDIAAATPEQSVSWTQAPSQDLEQSTRELPSLMVDVAHHNIPAS